MRIDGPLGWAEQPVAGAKFDRNAVELPRYADIERAAADEFVGIMARFVSDRDANAATAAFRAAMKEAQLRAFLAGRRAKGVAGAAVGMREAAMLAQRLEVQVRFWRRALDEIAAGRSRMDPLARARLYARSLWSIYTRAESVAWEEELGPARYHWIMDPDAEHCVDCLERARISRRQNGFTYDELAALGWPGENTRCMVNCRCHIRTVRRRGGQPQPEMPIELPDEPAPTPDEGVERFQSLIQPAPSQPSVPIPAAGSAPVRTSPRTAESLLRRVEARQGPVARNDAARALPLIPRVLAQPEQVLAAPFDARWYLGHGLLVGVARAADGAPYLAALAVAGTVEAKR